MHPKIRDAAPEDAERLVDFNVALARETEDLALDPARVRRGVEAVFADPARGRYHVVESQGRLVGSLLVTREWSDWRDGWFWWIQSVYVEPSARGRGAYRALWDDVRARARAAGDVAGLRLYVERNNRPARSVYERLGMTPSGYRLYELSWDEQPVAAGEA